MKKTIFIPVLFVFLAVLSGCVQTKAIINNPTDDFVQNPAKISEDAPANRLEVFYFHRTARCQSCTTVENYVRDLIEGRFAEEVRSGLIDFRTLNIDLPENEALARKFKATGSALYLNKITDGRDNIEFYADVWRLFGNEQALKDQLEIKINSLLSF